MADAQALDESVQMLVLGVARVVELLPELLVFKIDVSYTWSVFCWLWIRLAVRLAPCCELLKLHDVLGERACFVTENV